MMHNGTEGLDCREVRTPDQSCGCKPGGPRSAQPLRGVWRQAALISYSRFEAFEPAQEVRSAKVSRHLNGLVATIL